MNYLINNVNIHYEEYGKGEKILLLHGWGNDLNSFNKQLDCLKDKYHLYLIDLPGFGKTNEPNDIYSLDDYVKIVTIFIKNIIKEENNMIIGHSFGGRIGIKISTILNLKGLILISGAGIKHNTLRKTLKVFKYKIMKNYYKLTKNYLEYNFLIKNTGSSDYISLSSNMKESMKLIIKEDLRKYLKKIDCKTLLIYGDEDTETPYIDGSLMNKKIKDSIFYKIPNGNHFIHIEKSEIVNDIIERFLCDIYG